MKLNWAERIVVNNPLRVMEQSVQFRWLRSRVSLGPSASALEIGCGRGAGARLILKNFEPGHLHIMDVDVQMVRLAVRYLGAEEKARVSFYSADAARLPFKDESLDAVFGFGFLHHVPLWRKALEEVFRVLKPSGVYVLEELYPQLYQNFITRHILVHPTQDRFRSQELKEGLESVGLAIGDFLEFKSMGILGIAQKV